MCAREIRDRKSTEETKTKESLQEISPEVLKRQERKARRALLRQIDAAETLSALREQVAVQGGQQAPTDKHEARTSVGKHPPKSPVVRKSKVANGTNGIDETVKISTPVSKRKVPLKSKTRARQAQPADSASSTRPEKPPTVPPVRHKPTRHQNANITEVSIGTKTLVDLTTEPASLPKSEHLGQYNVQYSTQNLNSSDALEKEFGRLQWQRMMLKADMSVDQCCYWWDLRCPGQARPTLKRVKRKKLKTEDANDAADQRNKGSGKKKAVKVSASKREEKRAHASERRETAKGASWNALDKMVQDYQKDEAVTKASKITDKKLKRDGDKRKAVAQSTKDLAVQGQIGDQKDGKRDLLFESALWTLT